MLSDFTGKHAIGEDILRSIGEIAVEFSRLEARLINLTAMLINPDDDHGVGWTVAGGMDFTRLLDLLKVIITDRTNDYTSEGKPAPPNAKEIREALESTKGRLTTVNQHRRQVIHGHWVAALTIDRETGKRVPLPDFAFTGHYTKGGSGSRHQQRRWHIKDLKKLSCEIRDAQEAFDGFFGLAAPLIKGVKIVAKD